jgi:phosphatidylethanolamine-binding protein (PEBP) family uncharacterized protein
VAFLDRCAIKLPGFDPKALMTPQMVAWKARYRGAAVFRIDHSTALAEEGLTCKLTTTAFKDNGTIPGEFAFGVMDPASHVRLSSNRNPDFSWSDVPSGTRSLALVCHDPDVPSRGDDVNQEGRVVPASLPRVDFFHWALIDIPPDTRGIARGRIPRA